MTKIAKRQTVTSYEIYLSPYQAGPRLEDEKNLYKRVSPDFFDPAVMDECHWGDSLPPRRRERG